VIPHASPEPISLSVVIPVYNEIARVPATLRQVVDYLQSRPERSEVLVVDDGSTDATAAVVENYCRQNRAVRLIRLAENRGKGFAVRTGVMNAQGELILFTDADLSAPIAEAARLLAALQNGYDVAIGSRGLKPEWIEVHQSRFRESSGKLFNFCLRAVTGLPFRDTQCGFKAFRREAARRIFPLQTIAGFGFDAELLYIAGKLGCKTLETPVHWAHSEGTKVRMIRDGLRMGADLFTIRWNDLRGRYSEQKQASAE
jgi:glycosyltransferase involved in cell wall biosynthesis